MALQEPGRSLKQARGILNTSALSVKIDPLAEWPEIFDEAWRVNRDYFYDPGMHGGRLVCHESKICEVSPGSCQQKRP